MLKGGEEAWKSEAETLYSDRMAYKEPGEVTEVWQTVVLGDGYVLKADLKVRRGAK